MCKKHTCTRCFKHIGVFIKSVSAYITAYACEQPTLLCNKRDTSREFTTDVSRYVTQEGVYIHILQKLLFKMIGLPKFEEKSTCVKLASNTTGGGVVLGFNVSKTV